MVVVVGIGLTATVGWFVNRSFERLKNEQLAAQTDSAVTAVKVALDRVAIAVRAVRGMYAADSVTQDEFQRFAATLTSSEGFRSIAFYRKVEAADRAAYERRFTSEPAKTLGIWQMAPDGKPVRAGDRADYFVVESGYLLDGSQPAYGFDAASEASRADAMRAAIAKGSLVASDPVTLLKTTDAGVVFYVPAVDRRGEIIGIATGAITIDALANLAERTSGVRSISIGLTRLTAGAEPEPPSENAADDQTPGQDTFAFANKIWTVEVNYTSPSAGGVMRWALLLIIGAGLASTLAVLGYVVNASKTAQIAEARAQLRGMLDGLGPLAWLLTPEGIVISANRTATESLKHSEQEMIERPLWDLPLAFEGADQSERIRKAVQAARAGEDTRFDFAVEIDDEPRVLDLWVRPVSSLKSSNLVATAVDVTERHEAQETQRLLMRELDHRMKNTLQVIQAIIRRTAKSQQSVATFEQSLLGRIRAMSRAHELLAGERWLGADIDTIVRQETGSFDVGGVVRIRGPRIRLNPKAALSFALAIHELGTNASKYGGLSLPDGSVDISWKLERIEGQSWLVLTWQEAGGPPVSPPTDRGFGSMLIERSIAYELGGDAKLEFRTEGLNCVIKAPLQSIRPFVGERAAPPVPPPEVVGAA